jgi:hypothetical protein
MARSVAAVGGKDEQYPYRSNYASLCVAPITPCSKDEIFPTIARKNAIGNEDERCKLDRE